MSNAGKKTRRPRGTGHIYDRGGVLYLQYYDPVLGKYGKKSTGIRSSEPRARTRADQFAREFMASLSERPVAGGIDPDRTTLGQLAALRLQDMRSKNRSERGIRRVEELQNSLLEFFGRRTLKGRAEKVAREKLIAVGADQHAAGIGTGLLFELVEWTRSEKNNKGEGLSDYTVKHRLDALRRMLILGYEHEPRLVRDYPRGFPDIRIPRKFEEWYEPHEVDLLLGELPEETARFMEHMYLTAWRPDEIRFLKRGNVDLEAGTIRIEKSKNRPEGIVLDVSAYGKLMDLLRRQAAATEAFIRRTGIIPVNFYHYEHDRGRTVPGSRIGSYRSAWDGAHERLGMKRRQPYAVKNSALLEMQRAGLDIEERMSISLHKSAKSLEFYEVEAGRVATRGRAQGKLTEHHAAPRKVESIKKKNPHDNPQNAGTTRHRAATAGAGRPKNKGAK